MASSSSDTDSDSSPDRGLSRMCCVYKIHPGGNIWSTKKGEQAWFRRRFSKYEVMAYDRCNLEWGFSGKPRGLTFEFLWDKEAAADGTC
ncbi:hypothetical protein OOU_Y34scaffold00962g2 [Pyricularia oryzae Y34]|uniref:Uncharacterized protein n=4 Tax=Pyricularia oryzae TaxID=318829 RepID=Q2KGX0_PYRO7|nr:hypothetical protein 7bg7.2 [Pyricularia oryzae]EAQ70808.1 hypothetical protein MGCH7_ch7g215 [Pyricularia oryzae 70-15]ELQ33378.1 hypothetical protein OOU_Y34scaffold00962g2 [Pyricularia oryzae Y34]